MFALILKIGFVKTGTDNRTTDTLWKTLD